MPVTVTSQFMPLRLHLPNKIWKTVGHPSQKEKGPLRAVPLEEIQNSASILNNPRRPILPLASRNLMSERFHLEVVLDINTQYMFYGPVFLGCLGGLRIVHSCSSFLRAENRGGPAISRRDPRESP